MKLHQQRLDTGLSGGLAGQVGKLKWWWWVALPVRERDRFHQHAEDMLSIMGRETDLVPQQSYLATASSGSVRCISTFFGNLSG